MRRSNLIPEVNAGSMADIAFLLLIFFLVTAVIPKDKGINRKLSKLCPPGQICEIDINERNLLRIVINNNDEIMVDGDVTTVNKLKNITKDFLDNNGDGSCNYCQGQNLKTASDNPKEAVISLQTDKQTSNNQFIKVQDELTKAYYEPRTRYRNDTFKKSISDLSKEEMQIIKDAYPFVLSEAETK